MSSSTGDDGKKRRINYDGGAALSVGKGGRELGGDGFAQILSAMNQLLDQNRLQMAEMKRMADTIGSLEGEIKGMKQKCDVMEKSLQSAIELRFDVDNKFECVENRQKYHEVLLKNQQWKYSAPDIESADDSLEEYFLDDIKEQTRCMRLGWCDEGKVVIQSHGDDPLDYDAAFLPHWREVSHALAEYQHALKCLPEGTDLLLRGVELPEPVLNLLSNALESTHFKKFFMDDNNFGGDGIKFSLNYIQNNPVLEEFLLRCNPIDNEDDIDQLCEIIKVHPAIKKIELDECCGEGVEVDGHDTLRSILTAGANKLKCIDMTGNDITTGGSTFIADFLATNPILEHLELRYNNLNDEDAKSIASALAHNTNLHYFHVNGNEITDSGWDALRKAEFDSTSLNSAAGANHTCHIFRRSQFNGEQYGDRLEPKQVRQKKIYYIISERNRKCSNVQHFYDLPVNFLPDMLGSIQEYSEYHAGEKAPPKDDEDYVEALSVVYEIMRFWNEAFSVYELLSN